MSPELITKLRNTLPEKIMIGNVIDPKKIRKRSPSPLIKADANKRIIAFSQGRYKPIVVKQHENGYEIIDGEDTLETYIKTLELFGKDPSKYSINAKIIRDNQIAEEIINEVPMNTGVFQKTAIEAYSAGMIMGFEAEVCIPKEKIIEEISEKEVINSLRRYIQDNFTNDIEGLFRYLPVYDGKRPELISIFEKKFAEYLEANWEKLPQDVRKELLKAAKKEGKINSPIEFSKYIFNGIINKTEIYNLIRNVGIFEIFFSNINRSFIALFGDYSNAIKELKNILNIGKIIYFNSFHENDYFIGAKILEPYISRLGPVKVFLEYHQSKKKGNIWYIEPDLSIEPKEGDYAAEVVSPPMDLKTSLIKLKEFYNIANELGLYTGTEYRTGFHVNISIPDTELDVLKLAVFLGDEYVLKTFNRENNEYCESVVQKLKNSNDSIKKDKNVLKSLIKIVRNYTNNHHVSISYENDYVSFRHIGGDYLKDFWKIYEMILRFVRAFYIASNPNLYKKEYLAKVGKLISNLDTTTTSEISAKVTVFLKIGVNYKKAKEDLEMQLSYQPTTLRELLRKKFEKKYLETVDEIEKAIAKEKENTIRKQSNSNAIKVTEIDINSFPQELLSKIISKVRSFYLLMNNKEVVPIAIVVAYYKNNKLMKDILINNIIRRNYLDHYGSQLIATKVTFWISDMLSPEYIQIRKEIIKKK